MKKTKNSSVNCNYSKAVQNKASVNAFTVELNCLTNENSN